jgi:hypothetical protein
MCFFYVLAMSDFGLFILEQHIVNFVAANYSF